MDKIEIISTIISLSFIVFYLWLLNIICDKSIFCSKKKKDKQSKDIICGLYESPFSVSKYLERIEGENIAILRRREKEKQEYILVLWIGLNGLRMSDDGELEWIRRNEEKKEEKSASVPLSQRTENVPLEIGMLRGMQNCCNVSAQERKDRVMTTLAEIQQLQTQNTLLQYQSFMQSQTQNMINNISPSYVPDCFFGYGQFNPYYYYNPMQQFRCF